MATQEQERLLHLLEVMESGNKKRASAEQFELLLAEVEKRPHLLNSRVNGVCERVRSNEQWQKIADKLNSLGIKKSAAKWQQAWRDWKSNTRKKAFRILKEKGKSGDGKVTQPLTDLEVRVLNLEGSDVLDMKAPEIDISNIAEIDPLSSDEESGGSDQESFVYTPDLVTVYSLGEPETSNGVSIKTEKESPPHKRPKPSKSHRKTKRHRIEFKQTTLSTEYLRKESSEMMKILSSLEENRQSQELRSNAMLERVACALETNAAAMTRQAEAAETQARALDRLTNALETRYAYSSESPGQQFPFKELSSQ